MQEIDTRLAAVERGMLKMESVLESNSRSLTKIEETLETLTSIQISQAKDRAEFNAKILDCKGGLERAHKRIDRIEAKLWKSVGIVLTIIVASILSSIGLKQ